MSETTILEIDSKHTSPKIKLPFSKYDHISVLYVIAKGLASAGLLDNYVELGVSKGACFNLIAPLAKHAYAVDINKDTGRYIKDNKNMTWYRGRGTKFFGVHGDIKFDLIFIDAKHAYSDGLDDFNAAVPHMNPNCLIIMHDTYPPSEEFTDIKYCGNVHRAATHIRKHYSSQFEVLTLPFYYGLTIIRNSLGKQTLWKVPSA